MREERLWETGVGRTLYLSSLEARGNCVFHGVTTDSHTNSQWKWQWERRDCERVVRGGHCTFHLWRPEGILCFSWCPCGQSVTQALPSRSQSAIYLLHNITFLECKYWKLLQALYNFHQKQLQIQHRHEPMTKQTTHAPCLNAKPTYVYIFQPTKEITCKNAETPKTLKAHWVTWCAALLQIAIKSVHVRVVSCDTEHSGTNNSNILNIVTSTQPFHPLTVAMVLTPSQSHDITHRYKNMSAWMHPAHLSCSSAEWC